MSTPIKPTSAMDIAADGWKLGLKAIVSLPLLFTSGLVLLVLWELVAGQLGLGWFQTTDVSMTVYLLALPGQIVNLLVAASVAIAVHRFVVLDETIDRPVWRAPDSFGKFATWLFVLDVLNSLPTYILNSFGLKSLFRPTWVGFLYSIFSWFIYLRLILLFPAIATTSPRAGWRDAWNDSRGHLWKFFWATIWVALPFVIVLAVTALVIGEVFGFQTFGSKWTEPFALCWVPASLLTSAVAAATASRFFQLYGNSLVRETGPGGPSVATP